MGVKALTYVQPTGRTRAEQWARQDAERKAASDDGLDSFALGVATGMVVGPKSLVGSAVHDQLSPASDSGASESSYDSGSSDTGSSSSDSGSSSFD